MARLLILLWEHELDLLRHAHGVGHSDEALIDQLLAYARRTLMVGVGLFSGGCTIHRDQPTDGWIEEDNATTITATQQPHHRCLSARGRPQIEMGASPTQTTKAKTHTHTPLSPRQNQPNSFLSPKQRFSSIKDTTKRVLSGGVANRWQGRLNDVRVFLQEEVGFRLTPVAQLLLRKAGGLQIGYITRVVGELCDESFRFTGLGTLAPQKPGGGRVVVT